MGATDKTVKLKIEQAIYNMLQHLLIESNDKEDEALCFLYCNQSIGERTISLFPKVVIPVQSKYLDFQSKFKVGLGIDVLNKVYEDFAQEKYPCLISCHSHPFDQTSHPFFSSIDDANDILQATWFAEEIVRYKKNNNGNHIDALYLHLVKSKEGLTARYYDVEERKFKSVDCFYYKNNSLHISSSEIEITQEKKEDFRTRTDLAFGKNLSKSIEKMTVGVVGIGGIGSIVVEGLARLGVKDMILIDSDCVELSNLNRFQGAGITDINRPKVFVLRDLLNRIFPGRINVKAIRETVFKQEALTNLKDADLIIGCLDNNITRYFLNRFALQYLVPYIDGATRIIPTDNNIGVPIRVSTVVPSITSCMDCGLIEYYTDEEIFLGLSNELTRDYLKQGGYIKDQDNVVAPAVYPQNMIVSGTILLEVMNLIGGYKEPVNNICFDISTFSNCWNSEKQRLASPLISARAKQGCLNCDYYLGMGDSISMIEVKKK